MEPWSLSPNASCFECWTTLASIAVRTSRIRLGSLCSSNSYREPVLLARMATTLMELCLGRLELGISAGWGKRELGTSKGESEEFESYGIAFPAAKERIRELERGIKLIMHLCRKSGFSNSVMPEGRTYPSPEKFSFTPRVWICGVGDMMMRCVAKNADVWNAPALSLTIFRERNRYLDRCCAEQGRDPKQIVRSLKLLFDPENSKQTTCGRSAKKSFLWSLFYKTRLHGSRKDYIAQIKDFVNSGVEYFTLFAAPLIADPQSAAAELMEAVRENFDISN